MALLEARALIAYPVNLRQWLCLHRSFTASKIRLSVDKVVDKRQAAYRLLTVDDSKETEPMDLQLRDFA